MAVAGRRSTRARRMRARLSRGRSPRRTRATVALTIALASLTCLTPGIASALPSGSEYPSTWTIVSPTVATGVAPSGITVTATLSPPSSGTLNWSGPSGSIVATGPRPAFLPSTTTEALKPAIAGCSAAPCGSINFTFSQPVIAPSMLVGDMGANAGGGAVSGYHDSPISVAGGGTFSLDSTGSQSAGMSIQSGGTVVGIANPAGYQGQPSGNTDSCSASASAGFGCGAYDLQLLTTATTSVTLNFGYAGAGTTNDAFGLMLPAVPSTPALTVAKTATPSTINAAGDAVSYSFLVTNTGNVALSGVSVADAFVAPSSGALGPVSCPVTTLAVGASTTCTAPAYVATQADVDAGVIANSATATGTPPLGPAVTSPPSAATVAVPAAPSVAVVKSADVRSFPAPGTVVTYGYAVRNTGNVTLNPVVVSDPMPGLSAISCPQSRLAPAASETCTARYTTTAADVNAGSIRNTGTATGTPPATPSNPTPTPVRGTSTVSVPLMPLSDLELAKSASPGTIAPGTNETYTLVVRNHGPSPAVNVVVSDPLPAGLTFVSASNGCLNSGGDVTCRLAGLAAGATKSFTVTARVASSMDHAIDNTATVRSDTPDPDPGDNTSTSHVPVRGEADLALIKTPSTSAPVAGGQVLYTLVISNNGPSDATGVTVSDPGASGLTLQSATPSQGSCSVAGGRVSCRIGTLADGGAAQVLVAARVAADATGAIANAATVTGDQHDPTPGNNRATSRVTPTPPATPSTPPTPTPLTPAAPLPTPRPAADLVITKTTRTKVVTVGVRLAYTIVVRNNGPDAAPAVSVTDTFGLPSTIVSVKTTAGTCAKGSPLRCSLGTIAPHAKVTITVVAYPRTAGRLRNAVSATSPVFDANPRSNIAGVSRTAVKPTLKITKLAGARSIRAGRTVSYTIKVTNPSEIGVRSVKVCDTLPSGLVRVSGTAGARLTRGAYCWSLRSLAGGTSRSYRLTVRALPGTNGSKTNIATVRSPDATTGAAKRTVQVERGAVRPGGVTG
ncbi:MAG: conserved repeat domain protein [Conexibacter sp.]|nr:conserved repeat domain protein [Conexibacter sp.]